MSKEFFDNLDIESSEKEEIKVSGNISFELPEVLPMLKDLDPKDKIVDWNKYHPVTEEELEESYIKLNAAPDYSSEPENYKKG